MAACTAAGVYLEFPEGKNMELVLVELEAVESEKVIRVNE